VGRVRVIHAPEQDARIVVIGAVLWPDKLTLLALVESDAAEIASEFQEGDQSTMFAISDDLGNEYENGGGGGKGDMDLHVTLWDVDFRPGVPRAPSRQLPGHLTRPLPTSRCGRQIPVNLARASDNSSVRSVRKPGRVMPPAQADPRT
jgi:hypothetical protein